MDWHVGSSGRRVFNSGGTHYRAGFFAWYLEVEIKKNSFTQYKIVAKTSFHLFVLILPGSGTGSRPAFSETTGYGYGFEKSEQG
jgi:hypothetical protein